MLRLVARSQRLKSSVVPPETWMVVVAVMPTRLRTDAARTASTYSATLPSQRSAKTRGAGLHAVLFDAVGDNRGPSNHAIAVSRVEQRLVLLGDAALAPPHDVSMIAIARGVLRKLWGDNCGDRTRVLPDGHRKPAPRTARWNQLVNIARILANGFTRGARRQHLCQHQWFRTRGIVDWPV